MSNESPLPRYENNEIVPSSTQRSEVSIKTPKKFKLEGYESNTVLSDISSPDDPLPPPPTPPTANSINCPPMTLNITSNLYRAQNGKTSHEEPKYAKVSIKNKQNSKPMLNMYQISEEMPMKGAHTM